MEGEPVGAVEIVGDAVVVGGLDGMCEVVGDVVVVGLAEGESDGENEGESVGDSLLYENGHGEKIDELESLTCHIAYKIDLLCSKSNLRRHASWRHGCWRSCWGICWLRK